MNKRNARPPMLHAIAVILLLATTASFADRPRIGLVLGGGGARGAAHVGVLRELERQRVPIDAIAGTSMGAIVGGLYASGMSPDELEDLVGSLDWTDALSDMPPRSDLSFRRKQDDAQFPISLELGLRQGELLLPMGLVQGQKLGLLLRELTIDVSRISNFDELPIPFRAIATDIERGVAHVMADGDIAQAMRASMSVPAAFAPVRIGDRLLVDGGVVANLPVDVMREMGVDIIIAVDVEFPLYPSEELDSAIAISEQMLTILTRRETLEQIETLGERDILIRPELGTFSSSNFGAIMQTLEPGAQATRAVSAALSPIALDEQQFNEHLARRGSPPALDEPLAFVRIDHDGRLSSDTLQSRLDARAGDRIDTAQLANDAERLYGLDLYEQVNYRLVTEDGETGVEFQAISKSWGPNVLKFSVNLEDNFEGSTAFNVGTRITKAGINPRGAEWRTDLQLGTDPLLLSEFYQPFGASSRLFVAPRIGFRESNFNAFLMDESIARFRVSESEVGVDLGSEFGTYGEFRIGAYRGGGRSRVKVGDPSIPNSDFDTGGIASSLRFDTLDNARFPKNGIRANLVWNKSLTGFGADTEFDNFESDFSTTWSSGKNTWQIGLGYSTTLDSNEEVQDYFPLGGFLRLSGLERGAISGPHSALARLVYYRRVGSSAGGLFEVPIYLGASAEVGNVWQSRSDISFSSMQTNGSLFAGFDTLIGPVYIAAGFGEGGHSNYYLFFGSPPN